jgi:hypothetical protein
MIGTQACMSGYDCNLNPAQNSRTTLMASEMVGSCSVMQVLRRYHRPDNIKSSNGFHITNRFPNTVEVFIHFKTEPKPELLSTTQNLGSTDSYRGYNCSSFLSCTMVRKRSGALLKRELDNLSFLQSHPEVQRHFANAGCMEFVERLQVGCHQDTAEAFAKTFDGNKASRRLCGNQSG